MTGRPLAQLDSGALRAWARRSADALRAAAPRIDALNVFPVADCDTGTNMALTMAAAAAAKDHDGTRGGPAAAAAAMASGSLTAAQGSSGVILSRFLHGFATGFADADASDGAAVQISLSAAAEAAYDAVSAPVEGTMLSVAAAAAKAARDCDPTNLLEIVQAAAMAARDELARTTGQLPALAAAGVVDAGGQGLVVILDALVDVVAGIDSAPQRDVALAPFRAAPAAPPTFSYEVQYLLAAPTDRVPALRERLAQLGDAVAVVSDGELHNVHAHVNDVGAAIEAGVEMGRPSRIRVTRFADQVLPNRVIALCPAGDLGDLFRAGGAVVVEVGDDTSLIATSLTHEACVADVRSVVLLPNSRGFKVAADEAAAAARAAGRLVTVVPTRSPLQGLAALAVHDPARRVDDDAVAMSAASAATRYAEVTLARFDALTSAGPCHAGDVLGSIDDDVTVIGDDIGAVARELLDRMLIGGGELVTVISGADAPTTMAMELADYVQATRPAVETVVLHGGQPTYPLLLGVE